MLAMGRALMSKPQMLLLDEPSMGLSPILVQQIFDIIKEINQAGTSILLVEQNAYMALAIAHRAYVMETWGISAFWRGGAASRRPQGEGSLPGRRGGTGPTSQGGSSG